MPLRSRSAARSPAVRLDPDRTPGCRCQLERFGVMSGQATSAPVPASWQARRHGRRRAHRPPAGRQRRPARRLPRRPARTGLGGPRVGPHASCSRTSPTSTGGCGPSSQLGPGERIRFSYRRARARGRRSSRTGSRPDAAELVEPCSRPWTWTPPGRRGPGPQPGTFFPRRMAQETAVHRWDGVGRPDRRRPRRRRRRRAARAVRAAPPGRAAAALDGIDPPARHRRRRRVAGPARARTAITFEHGHAKGDVALRGRGRRTCCCGPGTACPVDDRFEVFGDPAPAASLADRGRDF